MYDWAKNIIFLILFSHPSLNGVSCDLLSTKMLSPEESYLCNTINTGRVTQIKFVPNAPTQLILVEVNNIDLKNDDSVVSTPYEVYNLRFSESKAVQIFDATQVVPVYNIASNEHKIAVTAYGITYIVSNVTT